MVPGEGVAGRSWFPAAPSKQEHARFDHLATPASNVEVQLMISVLARSAYGMIGQRSSSNIHAAPLLVTAGRLCSNDHDHTVASDLLLPSPKPDYSVMHCADDEQRHKPFTLNRALFLAEHHRGCQPRPGSLLQQHL
jgi:hypothetical protein